MLVCLVEGKVAGNCMITWTTGMKTRHRAQVAIALLKEYWRQGIGTRMFEEMIRIAEANPGILQMELDFVEGNARAKAQYVVEHYGYDCFSDDTGLEIDALGGEPGVHSARYGGVAHDSERNIDKVLRLMDGMPMEQRTAHFRTAICLMMDGDTHLFEGRVDGHILTERHGKGGFGYDSIFRPCEGDGRTFAQMTGEEKNAISHRGRAVARLVAYLLKR